MATAPEVPPDEFFAGYPLAREVVDSVSTIVSEVGPITLRITRSQAAFRRRRAFAFVWMPGRYLATPRSEAVLSIVLPRHDPSPRFAQVAHPSPARWIHHLDVHAVSDLDDEVREWLWEAAADAG